MLSAGLVCISSCTGGAEAPQAKEELQLRQTKSATAMEQEVGR
jgi:hypothetical protein